MLPYMPFHTLLFEMLDTPAIVLTSGNLSDEPILLSNASAHGSVREVDAMVSSPTTGRYSTGMMIRYLWFFVVNQELSEGPGDMHHRPSGYPLMQKEFLRQELN